MVSKFLRKLKKLIFPKPIIVNEILYSSYSQAGEDSIINFLFTDKLVDKISYLDIGTNMPDYCNNTYFFYKKGGRGVCVEADKTLIQHIASVRPLDKVINAGVAVDRAEGEADFFIFNNNGLNTFDKSEALFRQSNGKFKIVEVVKVSLIGINNIIENSFDTYPDLLSIDIEGLDLDVLKSLDFNRFPIPVICVETCIYSENHIRPKNPAIAEYLISKGYEIYADTYINTIFVNKNWFYNS